MQKMLYPSTEQALSKNNYIHTEKIFGSDMDVNVLDLCFTFKPFCSY